jgi:hypothetical protein
MGFRPLEMGSHGPRHGYRWITHATFRAHKNKPDVITLYDARPIEPDGRVLRFIVPFAHTRHGAVYRPRE